MTSNLMPCQLQRSYFDRQVAFTQVAQPSASTVLYPDGMIYALFIRNAQALVTARSKSIADNEFT